MTSRQLSRQLLALWLLVPCLLVACASVLGIEERGTDVAESYPDDGYAGCVAGNCSGCLDVHRPECEVRSTCAQVEGQPSCAGCVCQSCSEQLVECRLEGGCFNIWECLRETRCDVSERAEGNCLEACGTVVQANGGVSSSAWRAAISIRSCAASAACLSCLTPQVQQIARGCTQQNACQDCGDCFSQCLCSGERYGVCQDECGADAPDTGCSEDDGCASCTSCFDACSCGGKSFAECGELCSSNDPGPPSVCTSETSCTDCAGCVAQCVCSGSGDQTLCEVLCASSPHDSDACEFDTDNGYALCTDCTSCLASCTCNGTELSACMATCGHHDCCRGSSGGCPGGGATGCTCSSTADTCFQGIYGDCSSFSGCDTCACEQCPGALTVCMDTPGCHAVFECMRATECHGSACSDRCGSGVDPDAFAVAEALWACYHGSSCTCDAAAPIVCPSTLGNVECSGYQGPGATLSACCTQATSGGQSEQVEIIGDEGPCGLQLSPYFRAARACEPRAQSSSPRLEETCESRVVDGEVYGGATLRGCCRLADNTCGFFDDVTGLGCLSASIFGVTPQTCR